MNDVGIYECRHNQSMLWICKEGDVVEHGAISKQRKKVVSKHQSAIADFFYIVERRLSTQIPSSTHLNSHRKRKLTPDNFIMWNRRKISSGVNLDVPLCVVAEIPCCGQQDLLDGKQI